MAHWADPELGWAAAFALGAIVAPPDAVAATAISAGSVPRRGSSRPRGREPGERRDRPWSRTFAVAARGDRQRSPWSRRGGSSGRRAGSRSASSSAWSGPAWRRIRPDPRDRVSLLAPFAAYLPAEAIGVSGVLAVVDAGHHAAGERPGVSPNGRLMGRRLVGRPVHDQWVRLPADRGPAARILDALDAIRAGELVGSGWRSACDDHLARIVWVYPATYLPRWSSASSAPRTRTRHRRGVRDLLGGHARGRSLAAALALPIASRERPLLIYLTLCVILATPRRSGPDPAVGRPPPGRGVRGKGLEVEERIAREAAVDAPAFGWKAWPPSTRTTSSSSTISGPSSITRRSMPPSSRMEATSTPRSRSASSTRRSGSRRSPPSARPSSGSATRGPSATTPCA